MEIALGYIHGTTSANMNHQNGHFATPSHPGLAHRLAALWAEMDPKWQRFVQACWLKGGEKDGVPLFFYAPAAKSGHHHGYTGGLLEHTIEVAEIALFLAKLPANRDCTRQDLAVAGAMVHDVGKVLAYSWNDNGVCARSSLGKQTSHIALGLALIDDALDGVSQENDTGVIHDEEYAQIIHIVRSHHGLPSAPRTNEALIVHLADLSSASTAVMRDTDVKPNSTVMARWLGVSSLLGRAIRRGRKEMAKIRDTQK